MGQHGRGKWELLYQRICGAPVSFLGELWNPVDRILGSTQECGLIDVVECFPGVT